MNIVLITGKRSMRNLDTVLKKSEQAVTVGKYTSVRPNTATEIYEKYRPHGILVGDDTVTKCVSLIDFLSIIKMRYGYMRIIFMCSNDSSFNKYASALYSIGVYDIVVGYDPAAIDYAILNPKTETPDIPVTEDSSDENKELSYPDRKVHEYPGNFVGINYKDVSDNSYSMQTVRLTENYERIQRGNVIISVFGYNSRCGSTYTAFDIAFYLHKYERAKVCIVTAVTAGLCKYFNVDETTVNENGFNIDDVIIYSCFDKISDTFDYIVCDDGITLNHNAYIHLLLCSAADWDMPMLTDYINNVIIPNKMDVNLCFFPVTVNKFVAINKQLIKSGFNAYMLEPSDNWMATNANNNNVYSNILKAYIVYLDVLPVAQLERRRL